MLRKLLITLLLLASFQPSLSAQTNTWELIDTSFAHLTIIGNRILTQSYNQFNNLIVRQQYSDDNGKTWLPISYKGHQGPIGYDYLPDLTKIIQHPQYLLTTSSISGFDLLSSKPILYRSFTNGATWDIVFLPTKWFRFIGGYYLNAVTVQDSTIWGATSRVNTGVTGGAYSYGGSFFSSNNHGITWNTLNNFQDTSLQLSEKQIAATARTVLAINGDRTVLRFSKGSSIWNSSLAKLHERDTETYLDRLTSNRQHFFVIGSNYRHPNPSNSKLWRSNADGTEWKLLIEEDEILGLCIREQHLVVSTKKRGTLYSSNQGETWLSLNENNILAGMSSLAISDDGWIYGSGSMNGIRGIFRRKISP